MHAARSDASYKRSLEYLFYGQDPRLPGEIMRVAEEGFRSSEYYGQLGLDAAVSLSNSMSIADIPRIGDSLRRNGYSMNPDGTPRNRIGLEIPSGQLLITKVFLARCSAEKAAKSGSEDPGMEDAGPTPLVDRNQYPKHDSVFRVKATDVFLRFGDVPRALYCVTNSQHAHVITGAILPPSTVHSVADAAITSIKAHVALSQYGGSESRSPRSTLEARWLRTRSVPSGLGSCASFASLQDLAQPFEV